MPVVEPSGGGYSGPAIEDGLYAVTCKKIEEYELANDQYGKTHKLRLTLEGKDANGETFTVEPLVNQAWGENSTLFKYAQAFGFDPDPDDAFDTDELIGMMANALVETGEKAGSWPKVAKLTRLKNAAPKQAASNGNGAAAVPALITPVGLIDWAKFWREIDKLGVTRKGFAEYVDNDLTQLETMEPTAVVALFECVQKAVNS